MDVSVIGAYLDFGWDTLVAVLRRLSILSDRERRARAPNDVDISIRLRVKIPYGSISTNAHTSETFQRPSILTHRDTIEI
jgi:hypothetical protein